MAIRSTLLALALLAATPAMSQNPPMASPIPHEVPKVDLGEWTRGSDLQPVVERFVADRNLLRRSLAISGSPQGRATWKTFYTQWQKELSKVPFAKLTFDGQVDYLLLKNHVAREARQGDLNEPLAKAGEKWVPFASTIWDLREKLRRMEKIEPEKLATEITALEKTITTETAKVDKAKPVDRGQANRAIQTATTAKEELKEWFDFYNGYDPMFTWWVAEPYKRADAALDAFIAKLKEKLIANPKEEERVPPIGAEGLQADLAAEMIVYSAAELVEIANKEFEWCEVEAKKASRAMGFGDDWHKAMEHVKGLHVAPGEQPEMIREMAIEAIDYLEKRDLLTIPDLAKQTWRMTMMSPERQRTSPFFLGGEVIMVSFPTNAMTHEEKLMSMRGNNRHFARATVHHELIPGHHMQGFMSARYRPYRGLFNTPFWVEGWALYWEMLLWQMGFPATPENKMGMLFWRMHRCARIIFSLSYHLGTMTPEQCVDFLVERVRHERATADAEVRRSFNGSYPPLYQAAYMLGALQIWRMREELVDTGKMKEKDFHDALLKEGPIPIEMMRAIFTKQKLSADWQPSWRFYPGIEKGVAKKK